MLQYPSLTSNLLNTVALVILYVISLTVCEWWYMHLRLAFRLCESRHTRILPLDCLAHTKFGNHSVGCPVGIFSMMPLRSMSSISLCMSFFTCMEHLQSAFMTGWEFSFNCSLPFFTDFPRPSNLSGNWTTRSSKSLNCFSSVFCTTDTVACCTSGLMVTRSRALLLVRLITGPWVSHTKNFVVQGCLWAPDLAS